MKYLVSIIIFVFCYTSSLSQELVYTCSMHPEVQLTKPGDCPKCGMTLIKMVKKKPVVTSDQKTKNDSELKDSSPLKESTLIYTCPMHAEVQSDKPGKCPKCGMTLVKQKAAKKKTSKKVIKNKPAKKSVTTTSTDLDANAEVFTCPMHPEVESTKQGKCPKCGMDLVKKDRAKAAKTIETHDSQLHKSNTTSQILKSQASEYSCPMHPEIQSDKPGSCPKCGMTLIKNEANNHLDHDTITNTTTHPKGENLIKERDTKLKPGKKVTYHLFVTDTMVNFTGKKKHAFAVNGSIPAPTLEFTEGDTAEIFLHNKLKTETSLHWHGIILPNSEDGVPYLTTSKISAGTTHLYKFPIKQNGTYWYHSHTGLQEQNGMYGAIIIKKQNEPEMKTYTLVLSDWTDQNPHQVLRRLRNANDYFGIQKGSTQNYLHAIKEKHFKTKVVNEWKRMLAMDVSDVYYDRFLANGSPIKEEPNLKAGDKIKLRIVNGAASSYFWLKYAGGQMTVVASDGEDVEPVQVDRMIIAVAETYDIIVTVPENMSYEFLATSEDRISSASLWLGMGHKMNAEPLPRLEYFKGMKMMNGMMKTNGDMVKMDMNMSLQQMDMNSVMYPELRNDTNTSIAKPMEGMEGMDHSAHASASNGGIKTLNYSMLQSPYNTTLPEGPVRTMNFNLTGNMNRYVWTIDNKTVNEWDKILIKKGENIRIIITNNSMMRHPMHLHGHFFRVLNGHGQKAPLKNVLDIMPMETDTIEFAAIENGGDWFFHCHILYHMMTGMGNVFSYQDSPPNPELPNPKKAYRDFKRDNRMIHPMAEVGLESNGSDGELMFSTERWALKSEWRIGLHSRHGYESETYIGRYLGRNQWLYPFVGFDYHYNNRENNIERNVFTQNSNQNNRKTFVAGVQYTLPMLFVAEARIDLTGNFRMQISREDIPLTARLRLRLMANTDKEYMAGFKYIITNWFALSTHYDSDMGLGAGVSLTY